jgi:hypothetical protein
MIRPKTPLKISGTTRFLSAPEFQGLAKMPREVERFKNIRNPSTKRAYENAIKDFMLFTGIKRPEEFRLLTRAHVIAWRDAFSVSLVPLLLVVGAITAPCSPGPVALGPIFADSKKGPTVWVGPNYFKEDMHRKAESMLDPAE